MNGRGLTAVGLHLAELKEETSSFALGGFCREHVSAEPGHGLLRGTSCATQGPLCPAALPFNAGSVACYPASFPRGAPRALPAEPGEWEGRVAELGLKRPWRHGGIRSAEAVWSGHAGWPEPPAAVVRGCLGQAGAVGFLNRWLLRLRRKPK